MKKYMKFTMFQKKSTDKTYHDDPYLAVNFPIDENGSPVCPGDKKIPLSQKSPHKGKPLWKDRGVLPMRGPHWLPA